MKRSEMNKEYMWDLTDMYISDEAWEEDLLRLGEMIDELPRYIEHIKDDGKSLLDLMNYDTDISAKLEEIYVYANQKSHEDMSVSVYQDMCGKAQNIMVRYEVAASPIVPAIMEIGKDKVDEYMNEIEGLKLYERAFMLIFRKAEHVLSADKEELLAGVGELSETASDTFAMFNNADVRFEDIEDKDGNMHPLTHGTFGNYLRSKDEVLRKNAFLGLYAPFIAYRNTLAATYSGNLKQHNFFAKVRNYDSGMHYSLSGSNIPVSVYDSLIEAAHNSIDTLHRYVKIRCDKMGKDKVHMYDLYVPLSDDVDMKITYEEAKEIVLKGLAPLGDDYLEMLEVGFNNSWIDVYENEGKRSGAYSWGTFGSHPYVLLNHQDDLNSVFTLAHEMGHALHSYYSDSTQPYIYAGYKIFVAEVASTCNEALLVNYLIDNASSEEEKKYLVNYFLEQFRTTFFRQTMFAEFEKITHEKCAAGETLTADSLCEIYRDLNAFYYGDNAVIDDEIAMEWARIPHFYKPFYVYQYATGFAAAIAISSGILSGDENVLSGYRQFLRSGGSMDPIDLLKLCGVDMTTEEPVKKALEMFEKLLNDFCE